MTDRPRIPVHILNCGEVLDEDEDDEAEVDSEEEAQSNAFAMYQRRQRLQKEEPKKTTNAKIVVSRQQGESGDEIRDEDGSGSDR